MHGTYDYWLVALSLVVASLASYTALDLSGHISVMTRPRIRHAWLAGGAAAMGIGIWSMHFIGMLAFSLPIPLGYDLATTGCSLVIAMLLSYSVLYIVTLAKLTLLRLVTGGILMGFGIASMHYTGMAALQIQPGIHYDPALFVLSIVIAIAAANAALWIAQTLSDADQSHVIAKRIGAGFLMGIAITGMHYTGMAAAHFPPGSVSDAANGINSHWLATTVILLTFAILNRDAHVVSLRREDEFSCQLRISAQRPDRPPGDVRHIDRPAEPLDAHGTDRTRDSRIQAPSKHVRHPVHGSRRVQDHQ